MPRRVGYRFFFAGRGATFFFTLFFTTTFFAATFFAPLAARFTAA
jgi:hypothetical protein